MIRTQISAPCPIESYRTNRPLHVRHALGEVSLPAIGEVPTWLLIVAAAVAAWLFLAGKRLKQRQRAKRIKSRITEY